MLILRQNTMFIHDFPYVTFSFSLLLPRYGSILYFYPWVETNLSTHVGPNRSPTLCHDIGSGVEGFFPATIESCSGGSTLFYVEHPLHFVTNIFRNMFFGVFPRFNWILRIEVFLVSWEAWESLTNSDHTFLTRSKKSSLRSHFASNLIPLWLNYVRHVILSRKCIVRTYNGKLFKFALGYTFNQWWVAIARSSLTNIASQLSFCCTM